MFTKITNWINSIVAETKAISWPSRKRIVNDSAIVVASLVIGGAILAAIDFVFLELFKAAINKLG